MSSEKSHTVQLGCDSLLAVLLTVLFIGLKLTETIDWSWWWVLSPLWIYAGILALVFLIVVAVVFVLALAEG